MTEVRDKKTGTLPSPPRPEDAEVSLRRIAGSLRRSVQTAGEIAQFSAETLRDLPSVRLYTSEIFRQAGLLIIASGLIIWLMEFVIGGQCGLEAHYTLEAIGAPIYSGIFTSWCGLREMAPYMWGYILAAKVGCGLVAEIGSMRISEEIDAMEVMGVRSRSYLVATRVIAAWIAMPFLYVVGLGAMYLAEYLVVVVQLGGVSEGGYSLIFWLFQNPLDFAYSLTKVMLMGTVIVFVGCYYGFTASGGPVGVGMATAKSMMVNMVLIHVVGVLGSQLFWGLSPNAPIAN
ncbi:MAG TPA: ABC transporter permease [Mycobacteriales bacterium]|jgi:phospholipid/cholesterol/gamma-HCH transport system permease protein|nr:ABC transporter permease [Mycobacteriales bacterium]